MVRTPPVNAGDVRDAGFDPWVGKIPRRRAWPPTPVSCLESPRARGAWKAAVHGVGELHTTEWLST